LTGDFVLAIASERLKTIRKIRDLTQKQLEEASAVPQNTISRLELGKNLEVNSRTLAALARALNVSTDYLLGLKDDPE
jgi:transcriptional regulator with XRE-family HTH domain